MIAEVKSHITATLVAAGIPAKRVAQKASESSQRTLPYAELLTDPEQTTRDGTHTGRVYDAVLKTATNIKRTHRREVTVRVKIVAKSEAAADVLLKALFAGLGERLIVPFPAPSTNSQHVRIITGPVVWADDPGILKDRAEVEPRILFQGGIYEEITDGTVQQINETTANFN